MDFFGGRKEGVPWGNSIGKIRVYIGRLMYGGIYTCKVVGIKIPGRLSGV